MHIINITITMMLLYHYHHFHLYSNNDYLRVLLNVFISKYLACGCSLLDFTEAFGVPSRVTFRCRLVFISLVSTFLHSPWPLSHRGNHSRLHTLLLSQINGNFQAGFSCYSASYPLSLAHRCSLLSASPLSVRTHSLGHHLCILSAVWIS